MARHKVYGITLLTLVFVAFMVAGVYLSINWSWSAAAVIGSMFAGVILLNVAANRLGQLADYDERDTERRMRHAAEQAAETYARQAARRAGRA